MNNTQWHQQPEQAALTGVVHFQNVATLLREGELWLKHAATHCVLDLAGVTQSSSAGVALIMGMQRRAHTLGKQLTIAHVPENLTSIARLGGLDWLLNPDTQIKIPSNAAPSNSTPSNPPLRN